MHDPMTVAHEIHYPWSWLVRRIDRKRQVARLVAKGEDPKTSFIHPYAHPFITIWHRDPERRGDDDSCGFSVPHLTEAQRARLKVLAWNEARYPYFLRYRAKDWDMGRAEAEALWHGLVLQVCEYAGIPMTFEEAARRAALTIHNPDCTDAAGRLCFLPGWHENFKEDRPEDRERHFMGIICGVAAWILKDRRPWWRKPRWHVWHWRLQVHPWQRFRRWMFDRCEKCGGRFKGSDVCSNHWDAPRTPWFRSTPGLYHSACGGGGIAVQATPPPDPT